MYQVEFPDVMSQISVVDQEDMVEDDDSDREEEEHGHPFHQGMPPEFPAGFGGLGGLPLMPGMHLGGGMILKICQWS